MASNKTLKEMHEDYTGPMFRTVDYQNARQFLTRLNAARRSLTTQEYRTIKGCALAGDIDGAKKGLETVLNRRKRKEAVV